MLKAVVRGIPDARYQVVFETQSYGRTVHEAIAVAIPCASLEHARAVTKAYNGVAFTEERPAVGAALVAADMAELERKGLGGLNHHGEPIACGLSRGAIVGGTSPDGHSTPQQYRGAPMGVADYTAPDVTPLDTLHFGIRRVMLDLQGYAADGVYWGLPTNTLWHALATVNGATVVGRWFRGPTYAHAVARIREQFPNATTQRVP